MDSKIVTRMMASIDTSIEIKAMLQKIKGHLVDGIYYDKDKNVYHLYMIHPNPASWNPNVGLKDVDGVKVVPLLTYFDFDLTSRMENGNLGSYPSYKPIEISKVLYRLNGDQKLKLRDSLGGLIKLHLPVNKSIEV